MYVLNKLSVCIEQMSCMYEAMPESICKAFFFSCFLFLYLNKAIIKNTTKQTITYKKNNTKNSNNKHTITARLLVY